MILLCVPPTGRDTKLYFSLNFSEYALDCLALDAGLHKNA